MSASTDSAQSTRWYMIDYWRCPSCRTMFRKFPLFREFVESEAATHGHFPCPECAQGIDFVGLAAGAYDHRIYPLPSDEELESEAQALFDELLFIEMDRAERQGEDPHSSDDDGPLARAFNTWGRSLSEKYGLDAERLLRLLDRMLKGVESAEHQ